MYISADKFEAIAHIISDKKAMAFVFTTTNSNIDSKILAKFLNDFVAMTQSIVIK